mgnify:FL=1
MNAEKLLDSKTKLYSSFAQHAKVGLDLPGALLAGQDLSFADPRSADLRRADLRRVNLRRASLSGADLRGANLAGADLKGASLVGADLTGASLEGADLAGCDLALAKLPAGFRAAHAVGAFVPLSPDPAVDHALAARPVRLFLSAAPQDRALRVQLVQHLQPLTRQGLISLWHEGLLRPGAVCEAERRSRIEAADLLVPLVSAYFLQSDALCSELRHGLERRADPVRIIPVLARPVVVLDPLLAARHPLPEDGRPVTRWSDRQAAWSHVADGIRRAILK